MSTHQVQNSVQLQQLFEQLNTDAQRSLFAFAEFLHANEANRVAPGSDVDIPDEPVDLPRPESENVIAAIKRLSKTYPMLNSDDMLHETAHFMTEHIVNGREASAVIDDLEKLFEDKYLASKR